MQFLMKKMNKIKITRAPYNKSILAYLFGVSSYFCAEDVMSSGVSSISKKHLKLKTLNL